ncbi:MAG: hypothetical protein KGL39_26310 [Patescibacteria group bacterium]|nr:hypothetical protein [Patescibacteria group bacterium]
MSGSLLAMQGLGSSGNGMMPQTGTLPPGLLQMLLARLGAAGGSAMPGASMMGAGAPNMMGAPMINQSAGAPQGGNRMAPAPQMMGAAPQPAPGSMAALMQPGANGQPSQLSALLAQLKGTQTGVAPTAPVTGAGAGAMNQLGQPTGTPQSAMSPGLMQMLLQRLGLGSGMPGGTSPG